MYTDYNVCFERCRVTVWNDEELSCAHTRWNLTQSFEQFNRLLSIDDPNVAKMKQREIHIYFIVPYLRECLTKSSRWNWFICTYHRWNQGWKWMKTIESIHKWFIPIITFVSNDAEYACGMMQSYHMHIPGEIEHKRSNNLLIVCWA